MQWFSNGVLFDVSGNTADEQRFIGGVLLDGPGPLDTTVVPDYCDIVQDAPFAEQEAAVLHEYLIRVNQDAPFAEQGLGVARSFIEAYADIEIASSITIEAIRTAVTTAFTEGDIEVAATGQVTAGPAHEVDITQDAPFSEQELAVVSGTTAEELDITQDAPFATQNVTVTRENILTASCPHAWMSNGVLFNTAEAITTFSGGICLNGCEQQAVFNIAGITQDAPFSETGVFVQHYLGITIAQDAPFAEQELRSSNTATSADVDQTSTFAEARGILLTGTGGAGSGCGNSHRRRRRCCCCGGEPRRGYPRVDGSFEGFTAENARIHWVYLPDPVEEGDLLILALASDGAGTPVLVNSTNWTLLRSDANGVSMRVAFYYSWALGGEPLLIFNTAAQESISYACYRISGADPLTAPVITAPDFGGANLFADPPSISPWSGANYRSLYLAACGWDGNYSLTDYPNYFSDFAEARWPSVSGVGVAMGSRQLEAVTVDPSPYELSGLTSRSSYTLAIRGQQQS